jgi:hypothetical protein
MKKKVYRVWTNRILLVLTFFILFTGFGITYPGIIEPLTLGFLGKSLSFRLHTFLWGPFAVAVLIHLYLATPPKAGDRPKKQDTKR